MIEKEAFIESIILLLKNRFQSVQSELNQLEMEQTNETKSSAGDKFETSREMMKQSQDQLRGRLENIRKQLRQVSVLNKKRSHKIDVGSLAYINATIFFFGIGLGKVEFQNKEVIAVSLNSPFAKTCLGKKKGDQFEFNQILYQIKEIL